MFNSGPTAVNKYLVFLQNDCCAYNINNYYITPNSISNQIF